MIRINSIAKMTSGAFLVLGLALAGCGGGGDSGGGGTHQITAGTWGSATAEFDVSSTGETLKEKCTSNDLPPITADSNGNFSIQAQYDNPPISEQAIYDGHVQGNTMHIDVKDSTNPSTVLESYDLTLGQVMPPYTGSCPG